MESQLTVCICSEIRNRLLNELQSFLLKFFSKISNILWRNAITVIMFLFFQDTRDLLKEKDPDIKDHDLMMRDPRAFLANLPPLPTLEAFQRHRDLMSSPQSFLSAAAASLRNPGGLMPPTSLSQHLPPFGMSPLQQRPPSQPTTPSSQSSSPVQQNFGGNQQNWSFEEQFKQVRLFVETKLSRWDAK